MPTQFSPVIDSRSRRIPGFNKLAFIDLDALGVYASPLAVLDDFFVEDLPFSAHPHAGFAAVTYVFEDSKGAVRSRTSTGADLLIGPGGIVWTQAGHGVIHEEVPAVRGVELHGLQLFVNLTSEHKMDPPRVLALEGKDVPEWRSDEDDRVRVVVGTFDSVASPLQPDEPFTMLDIELRAHIEFTVTAAQNTVLYALDGIALVGSDGTSERLGGGQAVAISRRATTVGLDAATPSHLLVMSGLAIDEPVVEEGPFLMNDRAQLEATMARYRSGAMGSLRPI
jgi:redox-sensitive bicupin YhaK (pirin superfamily)